MEKLIYLKGNCYFDSNNIHSDYKKLYNQIVKKYVKTPFNKINFGEVAFIPALYRVFDKCINSTPKNLLIDGAYIFNYMLASERFVNENVGSNIFVEAAAGMDVDFIINQFNTQNQFIDDYQMKNQTLDSKVLRQKSEILKQELMTSKIPKDLK